MNSYAVKTDIYEGPFELLMDAIKEGRIDIYEVSLCKITGEYLEYLRALPVLDLNSAAQFLLMVACLLEMKSKKLLPRPGNTDEIIAEDEIEMDLARRIEEYNIYKRLAEGLKERKNEFSKIFSRYHFNEKPEEAIIKLKDVSLEDLVQAFQKVWEEAEEEDKVRAITEEAINLPAKIEEVKSILGRTGGRVHFRKLFVRGTRVEIVVTFLAVLELVRQKKIELLQGEKFGEIYVSLL